MLPASPVPFLFPRHSYELTTYAGRPAAEPGDGPPDPAKKRAASFPGKGVTDAMLAELPDLPALEWVHIGQSYSGGTQEISPAGLGVLSRCEKLRWLNICAPKDKSKQWFTIRHISALADLPAIEVLMMENLLGMKGAGIKKLAGLSTLKVLSMRGCKAGKGIGALSVIPGLHTLILDAVEFPNYYANTPITDNVLAEVGTITSLRSLSLRHCTRLKTLDGIAGLKKLEVLDLRYCNTLVRDDALAALAELPSLAILNTDGVSCKLHGGLAPLTQSKSLRALQVNTFRTDDSDMETIGKIKSLRYLSLDGHSGNSTAHISPAGAAHLTHLTHLDMKYTEDRKGCGVVMSRALMAALAALPLTHLRLRTFDKKATPALFEPLAHCKTLKRLHIEDATGIGVLREALPDCHITTSLHDWEQLDGILPLGRWTA